MKKVRPGGKSPSAQELAEKINMADHPMISAYLAGPALLRDAVAAMSKEQLLARPIAGKWSTQEVVCHLADTEQLYVHRMKRVIAEEHPTLFALDPDIYVARMACARREVNEELQLVEVTRQQMGRILQCLGPADFARRGIHSEDGPLSLETLLERIVAHLPHHVRFIREKRKALGLID